MAEEIEIIVAAMTGAFAGGTIRPVLAPFDALSEVWTNRIIDRINRTAERVQRKKSESGTGVSERVAIMALTEASLTDDFVTQEYLAGIIASATKDDDNAHFLALIRRMTPFQLRLHYLLYLSTIRFDCDQSNHPGNWKGTSLRASDLLESDLAFELNSAAVGDLDLEYEEDFYRGSERTYSALDHLRREELLTQFKPIGVGDGFFQFKISEFGAELFSVAMGIQTSGLTDLLVVHPNILLIDPPLSVLNVNYAASLLIDDDFEEIEDGDWK
jgi:hypothetical protein